MLIFLASLFYMLEVLLIGTLYEINNKFTKTGKSKFIGNSF